jgi:hypothetical protein
MRNSLSWSGFLIMSYGLTFLPGCIDDDGGAIDTTAPVIELHYPESGSYQEAGGFVHFESTFKDDLQLASYSIDVHDNLDGHGHGRIAQPTTDPSLVRWSLKRNYSIPSGLIIFVAQHDDNIEISSKAIAGPYHFIVQAVDMAGNATSFQDGSTKEIEMYISNDSQPVISITNLVNDELELKEGVPFRVEGDIIDPTSGVYAGIHSLDVILGEGHEEAHQHDQMRMEVEDLIDVHYEGTGLDAFMVNDTIILDLVFGTINFTLSQQQHDDLTGEGIDHLILTLEVRDEQGNLTIQNTPVYVPAD